MFSKKDLVLSVARKLFLEHGLKRVSVEQICQEAGASKMSFYRSFANKKELAKLILTDWITESYRKVEEVYEMSIPFSEKLEKLLASKARIAEGIGQAFLVDLMSEEYIELRNQLFIVKEKHNHQLIDFLKKAQHNGEVRSDLDIPFFMMLAEKIGVLAADTDVQKMMPTPALLSDAISRLLIYGIEAKK